MAKWEPVIVGIVLGLCVGGPIGAVIGGVIGGAVSSDEKQGQDQQYRRLPSGYEHGCPPPGWNQPGPRSY